MRARPLGRIPSLWLCVPSALFVLVLSAPRCVAADDASYEEQRVQMFLDDAHLTRDPAPEGKTIRYVRIERRQVLEPHDLQVPVLLPHFASTWTNVFHWLSEESMVRRELLLRVGDAFDTGLAAESERNLRALSIIALVKVVAVQTNDPTSVGVIVYTRDLWSLRFEQSFAGAGSHFVLAAQLVERNLFGRGKLLGVRASLLPLTYMVGQTYVDPRVWQSDLRASESLDVIFNRHTAQAEGSTGTFRFGRPFYNLEQRTSFGFLAYYLSQIHRSARADRVLGMALDPTQRDKPCDAGTPGCVPSVWDDRRVQLDAAGDYRVGERYKQTFTLGASFFDKRFAANRETNLQPDQVDFFRSQVLPKSRRDVYPYVRYRLSLPRFLAFTNLATFARTESVQVGPWLDGQFGVPLRAYGSSSDGMTVHGVMGYVWAGHDALVDVAAEGEARLDDGRVVDQRGIVRVRGATPSSRELWGRFVMRAFWDVHHNDTQRTLVSLGADEGLRGFATQQFADVGASRFLYSVEYRTRPWLVQSVHIGLVAFYDAGGVYRQLAKADLHHGVGAGLRVLLPQFNPYAFRLDAGLALGEKSYGFLLSWGGDQVLALTPEEDAIAAAGARQTLVQ